MASVLRMKGFSKAQRGPESESGPHIKTPGVTDPRPECKQSSRSKEKRERVSEGPAGIREGREQCSRR